MLKTLQWALAWARLSLCLSHCCYQDAQNLQSQACSDVHPKSQAGNADTTSYVDLWNQVESKLLPTITEYLCVVCGNVQSILRNVLKALYGQLWNMNVHINMAYVQKMPCIQGLRTATSNARPLCSLEVSGSHLLGGCRHRDMVKSYVTRHNEAGRLILEAMTKGTSGNNGFIADLGTEQIMQAVGAPDTRLPPWLAQETTILEMRQDGEERNRTADSLGITAPEDRLKTRRDLMMVGFAKDDLSDIKNRKLKMESRPGSKR